MFSENIFKAYDIRGIYPLELNAETAYRVGRAFTLLRQQELNKQQPVRLVIGHDMRLSSPDLFAAVLKGVIDQGGEAIDVGLISTPTFYFAVAHFDYDGGILITASHNPKEYNGLKMVRDHAKPVGMGLGMEIIRASVLANNFPSPVSIGRIIKRQDITGVELAELRQWGNFSEIQPLTIVTDTANSMGITYLDALFANLPQVRTVKINSVLDGNFPSHQPDPFQLENIRDLQARVIMEKADLGIATDGDGDRIFFIDNEGRLIEPAIVRGIMARIFLRTNPGAVICYDIRPGKITEDLIVANGGQPSITRVGHSFIKDQMLKTNAVFGGESSGHFFVRFPFGTFESPLVVTLKLLQELSVTGLSAAEYVKPLRRYFHSGEINFIVADKAAAWTRLRSKYHDAVINDLDGLTFTYPDWWFNVRASNTEPLLRLNLETVRLDTLNAKIHEVKQVIMGEVAQ